ncbi:MAG: lysophospholipid acyltransferase family protein, partial [Thermocrispum sp.]
SAQARAELGKLVDRVRDGTSVVIFPEGARTTTPVLAPFRKGAFHLAMQAGVPLVPIVLRNTGELMWRRSKLVNPGIVQVAVLDPVPTGEWTTRTLDVHVKQVRHLIAQTMENWPEGT